MGICCRPHVLREQLNIFDQTLGQRESLNITHQSLLDNVKKFTHSSIQCGIDN